MIDLSSDLSDHFGYHRHGWSWVVKELAKRLHDASASLELISFAEKSFLFQGSNSDFYPIKKPCKPWIGVFHLPPCVPAIFSLSHQLKRFANEPELISIMKHCVGIASLSSHLDQYLRADLFPGLPSTTFFHPAPYNVERFRLSAFKSRCSLSGRVPVVQLGFWLRQHYVIHKLATSLASKIDPFQVGINNPRQLRCWQLDLAINRTQVSPSVFLTNQLSNKDYDRLLSESIVLIPLYDTSANNSLIECMTRCTPVLVQRHPSVVEYLGSEYPLFYSDDDHLAAILDDPGILSKASEAHEYLAVLAANDPLSISQAHSRLDKLISSIL